MKHKYLSLLMLLILATPLFAQEATTPPAPATPVKPPVELTSLEKAGLLSIQKEYQQLMQEFSQANIDIAKNHPGYHLDPKNPFSGALVKEETIKTSAKTPEKTEEKTNK